MSPTQSKPCQTQPNTTKGYDPGYTDRRTKNNASNRSIANEDVTLEISPQSFERTALTQFLLRCLAIHYDFHHGSAYCPNTLSKNASGQLRSVSICSCTLLEHFIMEPVSLAPALLIKNGHRLVASSIVIALGAPPPLF